MKFVGNLWKQSCTDPELLASQVKSQIMFSRYPLIGSIISKARSGFCSCGVCTGDKSVELNESCFYLFRLSMGHQGASVHAPPLSEACCCFVQLLWEAHTQKRSLPWSGSEPRFSRLRAKCSTTELSAYLFWCGGKSRSVYEWRSLSPELGMTSPSLLLTHPDRCQGFQNWPTRLWLSASQAMLTPFLYRSYKLI